MASPKIKSISPQQWRWLPLVNPHWLMAGIILWLAIAAQELSQPSWASSSALPLPTQEDAPWPSLVNRNESATPSAQSEADSGVAPPSGLDIDSGANHDRSPAEPEPAEPEPAESEPAEPEPAEPEPAESEPAEPEPAEPTIETLLEAAQQESDRQNWPAAIALYEAILQQDPNNLAVQRSLALTYAFNQNYAQSHQLFQQLIATQPNDLELQRQQAEVYSWQREHQTAIDHYNAILEDNPTYLPAALGRAQVLGWQGRYPEALAAYDNILQTYPNNLNAQIRRAETISWQGNHQAAIDAYDRILQAHPDNLDAQIRRAQVLSWQEQHQTAIDAYETVLTADPDNLEAQLGQAQVLALAQQYQAAIDGYNQILIAYPHNLEAQLGLAQVLAWAGRHQNALAQYQAILERYPNSVEALSGQAQVIYWQGQSNQAIARYEAALARFPESPQLRLGLASIYQSQQKIHQALAVLQPLLDAAHPEAERQLRDIRAIRFNSEFHSNSHNFGESNQLIQQTVQFRIDDSDTLQSIQIGRQTFRQNGFESIANDSLRFGISGNINQININGAIGIDTFDRLTPRVNANAQVTAPIAPNLFLSGDIEYGSHKTNVATIENGITAIRLGPTLYWQIDDSTSLFSFYRWGTYSDGNQENQFFFNLERSLGDFYIAGQAFLWNYAIDPGNGYFSPSNFLTYGVEFGWDSQITDNFDCRLSIRVGLQRLNQDHEPANVYHTRCTVQLSPTADASLGYQHSSIIGQNSGSESFRSNQFTARIRFQL